MVEFSNSRDLRFVFNVKQCYKDLIMIIFIVLAKFPAIIAIWNEDEPLNNQSVKYEGTIFEK